MAKLHCGKVTMKKKSEDLTFFLKTKCNFFYFI